MTTATLGALLRDVRDPVYVGCDASTSVGALVVDSRKVQPGDVFVALVGETTMLIGSWRRCARPGRPR